MTTETRIKLFLDEHIWQGLSQALRELGYDALHVYDVGRGEMEDDEQGRAVLTFNLEHFVPLAALWYETGRAHAGILLSQELQRGELLRRVKHLLAALSAQELANTVRFLNDFK